MFYLINLLLVPIYWFIINRHTRDKLKKRDRFFKVVFVHAILFRSLANPYNYVDVEGYAIAYENIAKYNLTEALTSIYSAWGVGYVVFNWLLSRISEDPSVLFIVMSVMSVGGVMLFYKKTSYALLPSIMLYLAHPMLYLMGFGVVRQHLSIIFVLLALYNFNNYKKSLPIALLAVLMHTSCIIFLPFFLWKFLKIENWRFVPMLIVVCIGMIVMRLTMSFFLSYLDRYNESFGTEGSSNIVPIIFLGLLTMFYYISRTIRKCNNPMDKIIINFMIYAFLVSLFCYGLHGAGRLTLIFIYVIPTAMTILKNYSKGIWYYSYIVIVFSLVILMLYKSIDNVDYEYISIWETVKNYK